MFKQCCMYILKHNHSLDYKDKTDLKIIQSIFFTH